jgi:hypothetical protein
MTGKSVVGFLADVLYLKGFICYDEFEDIMNAHNDVDLGVIVEKMLRSEYNVYKKGESYGTLIK